MVFIFITIIAVFLFSTTPFTVESIELGTGEPLDLQNPIDVGYQTNAPLLPTDRDIWQQDGGVVLYDDPRDELRRREGVINNNKKGKKFWINNAEDSRRQRIDRKLVGDGVRRDNVVAAQRERDRINHSLLNVNRYDNHNPINPQRPLGDFVDRRIQKEREEEITREVEKARRVKEEILEDIIKEKRRIDRKKHTIPDPRQLADPEARLGESVFANRRGNFESSLERREMERRNRLSQIGDQGRINIKRDIDINERLMRNRERRIREGTLNWEREEEKLRQIERRREAEILNEERIGIDNPEPVDRRHFNRHKPPILIYEKIPVPIPVRANGDYDDYNDQVSNSFDSRESDDSFLDRWPVRPDHSRNNDIRVEEKVVVEDLSSLLPISAIEVASPVFSVDPAIGANIAFTNLVAATELETLNQAAALADINALAHLQQAAALANINEINAINNQVALNQLHGAAVLSSANAIGQVANAAAVADHAAIHTAKTADALLSQSLLKQQLVGTALVDDHIAKAQKVDFLNLVFQHGLRNALREQLRLHLRSKVEEEAFINGLQVTKEDLIRRLLMLRPYFKSPSQAGFILPAFIPNIPVGFDATTHILTDLPKIPVLPTTLLAPDFRLPSEIADDLKDKIDIAFVEHILRLPEHIFQKVTHLHKKEFIVTLFPTLYRETVKHIKYDPVTHYSPNIPHSDIAKEHHHHHFHVHKPPIDHRPDHLYHEPPHKDHGYPSYDGVKVDPHVLHPPIHPHEQIHYGLKIDPHVLYPPIHPHEQIHDGLKVDPHVLHPPIHSHEQIHDGLKIDPHVLHTPIHPHEHIHDGVKIDPHAIHPPIYTHEHIHDGLKVDPHVIHPLINPHGHINDGLKGDPHVHHPPVNLEGYIHDKHDIIQSSVPVLPHREVHIVRHPVHSSVSVPIPNLSVISLDHPRLKIPQEGGIPFKLRPQHRFPHGPPLPLEGGSSYIDYNSREHNDIFFKNPLGRENSRESDFSPRPIINPSEQVSFPPLISPHPVRGINVRHKGEEGHEIISTTTPPVISTTLIDGSFEDRDKAIRFPNSEEKFPFKQITSNDFRSVLLTNKEFGSTIIPFDSDEIGHSTLRPKKIDLFSDDEETSTSSPPPFEPFSTTSTPFTTFSSNNPTTLHPFFSTLNSIDTVADIRTGTDADKEDQAIELLASKETFSSTISPFTNTLDSRITPFRGFSGNVRQKPISEKLTPESQSENSLNWTPGTDVNDDSHLASFFQKKKGNATHGLQGINEEENNIFNVNTFQESLSPESVVNKVKRITDFFGTHLQERTPPHIQHRNANQSALYPFFHRDFNTLNDHIKSPSSITSKNSIHGHDAEQSFPEFIELLKIGAKEQEIPAFQMFTDETNKNVPMPRRIHFSAPSFETKLQAKRFSIPFQGPLYDPIRSSARNIDGEIKLHNMPNRNTFAGITVQGIENLPSFLREPPLCSNADNVNRSFCIYPDGYQSDQATQVVRVHENQIRELLKIIDELPKLGPDLNEASKQIPNLNLSVSCETEKRRIKLSWSRDILGSWLSILQNEPFEQYTTVITCGDSARDKGCRPLLQPRPFVAFHPKDSTGKPYIMEFPLPVGCVYAGP